MLIDREAQVPLSSAKKEAMPEKFLPISRHVREDVLALDGGNLMMVYELSGRSFETSDIRELNNWHYRLNEAWRNLHDHRISVWTHLIRSRVNDFPDGDFHSAFARDLNAAYRKRITGERMFVNRFFVTIVVRRDAAQKIGDWLKRKPSEQEQSAAERDALELLHEKASDFENLLVRCEPRRLTMYEHKGIMFSEPLEVMNAALTCRFERVPVVRGHLSGALYPSRVIFGAETIEVRDADRSHFGGIFGVREYPAQTVTGQLGAILALDFPFVLTQSFTFLERAKASERFRLRKAQMENAGDKAISLADDLAIAADDLQSGRFVLGDHHLTFAVYAPSVKALRECMSQSRTALAALGMVVAREAVALEAAYWSQLVGNFAWRARPSPITSLNFAAFSPFYTFPAGAKERNWWDDAVTLLKTSARSPYYFNFHKGDLGHTLIVGPSGGGKTVLMNFLLAQAEKTGARQIFIDKDRGAEIFVRACGGTYLALANGAPTGFNPLKALTNSGDDIAFLGGFIKSLVRREDRPFTVQDEKLIAEAITSVMALPPAKRSFSALRTMMGMRDAEGVGARLEKWTAEGSLGWVFDNEADALDLSSRFLGFDMTDFLDNQEIRTPLMLYLFRRIDALLTGQRVIISIDEFWKALGDDAFRGFAQDGLKTYRKRNALLVFATQSPADALRSDISHSILEQVATKIFLPNPFGSSKDYREGFALTAAEYALIREELAPESHKFLVKQGHDSVVVQLDLNGLDDELAVLSGRAETTAIVRELIASNGNDPVRWLPLFKERYAQAS